MNNIKDLKNIVHYTVTRGLEELENPPLTFTVSTTGIQAHSYVVMDENTIQWEVVDAVE